MPGPQITPNHYQLSGSHLHVNYSTSGIDGKPHLTYQDATQTLNFAGDQIRSVQTEIGTLVNVTIRMTVDSGSTSFSVLIPRVNLQPGQSAPIHTEGIITIHRFSIVPLFNTGQLDSYSVKALSGTASRVEF